MTTLPDLPCYLNGDYTTLPHAKVSVMDRGFVFGDGIYEVVPVDGCCLIRFEQHRARLARSLAETPKPTQPCTVVHHPWRGGLRRCRRHPLGKAHSGIWLLNLPEPPAFAAGVRTLATRFASFLLF